MSDIKKQRNTAITTSEFIERAALVHASGSYDYSMVCYVNSRTKVDIVCTTHGCFKKNPKDFLYGSGCPKCGASKMVETKRAAEESILISKFNKVHSYKYDYSKVHYINAHTECTIMCPVHGSFQQIPASHTKGHGCNKCAAIVRGDIRRSTLADTISNFQSTHKYKYDYSLVEYKSTRDLVTIVCPLHGEFKQTPNNHQRGQGCPSCCVTGFDKNKPAVLYYLKVEHLGEVAYKIGVTNLTVNSRYVGELGKFVVLAERLFPYGGDAYKREQEIIRNNIAYKYTGTPLLRAGNTELFAENIIKDIDGWFN